jgi:hypothetical protein
MGGHKQKTKKHNGLTEGTMWRPRFPAIVVNPNEQVNSVDFGQMTVNLGHHLENIIDNP